VGNNLLASQTLTHIFIFLKIGLCDMIFGLTCRPWSCLLYCSLWYSLHCVVVEQFAILKKIPGFTRCPTSSLFGVGAGRAHAPSKAPGLYAWGDKSRASIETATVESSLSSSEESGSQKSRVSSLYISCNWLKREGTIGGVDGPAPGVGVLEMRPALGIVRP